MMDQLNVNTYYIILNGVFRSIDPGNCKVYLTMKSAKKMLTFSVLQIQVLIYSLPEKILTQKLTDGTLQFPFGLEEKKGKISCMVLSKKEREFRKVYSEYYPVIMNTIYKKVGNMEDSEDICHEVFTNYYNKFDEIIEGKNWLFAAIRYGISNFYRKKGTANTATVDIDVSDDPGLGYENGFRDIRIVINEAIESDENYKDKKEQVLFQLIAIYGYTYEQAAKQLGLSKRQVFYKYKQITKRILDYLDKRGISDIDDLL